MVKGERGQFPRGLRLLSAFALEPPRSGRCAVRCTRPIASRAHSPPLSSARRAFCKLIPDVPSPSPPPAHARLRHGSVRHQWPTPLITSTPPCSHVRYKYDAPAAQILTMDGGRHEGGNFFPVCVEEAVAPPRPRTNDERNRRRAAMESCPADSLPADLLRRPCLAITALPYVSFRPTSHRPQNEMGSYLGAAAQDGTGGYPPRRHISCRRACRGSVWTACPLRNPYQREADKQEGISTTPRAAPRVCGHFGRQNERVPCQSDPCRCWSLACGWEEAVCALLQWCDPVWTHEASKREQAQERLSPGDP
jgi:hypothetical protein